MEFSGQNVLITGATRGIGRAIALLMAGCSHKEGGHLKVWINYRSNPESADSLKYEIDQMGAKAALVKFDVTDEKAFVEGIQTIVDADGGLSYLVNNAGIVLDKLALRMKTEEFTQVLDTNLKSVFIGCREALKVMGKQRFGSVVNISSVIAERGNMGQVNYAASKGGILSLTKSFAYEGALRGIRFNAITPGFIDTDMTHLEESVKEAYLKNIPLARLGQPKEVAGAVAFLLSDLASYITGEVLKINGGLYM
ncbi:3-oxoacyl-ACP reductase FabG [Helicobacter heilmannii]|uniref:3-oxoacyl-[acyl-carrier protein] reductase n=2 Tax=Helicobacter heilmannii TaxID=35817 RepID=A0A0K2Y2L8_HELHE|nr:3-oxoacyl-ACP reductase FabG [Helicobacter heilmannii]BDQ27060.1 3-oxoacyl-[acyl-carrier-protein] reductase [Helicobacter heilmannii]CRF47394.1 3-oxoacyl-[acyl-carrier protein] reductase [Helicobacter heilmannii]CRF51355.1 3-oxoacyl-[acyl-carrier protein] reductase [Helicobacter heilmannii]CRI34361.1 3-oxoacyl-[acyl-carrier protein] reductase [Helicobacter heilmannii]